MIVECIEADCEKSVSSLAPKKSHFERGERQRTHSLFKTFINLQNTHQKSAQVHVLYIKHSFKYTGM
jgi:hypothetical protein